MNRSEKVSVASSNKAGPCPAVLIKPHTVGLIVLQEWWGLNQQIQDEARLLSDRGGFLTIVPDLYRGKTATDNEGAGHLMTNLDWPGAVEDIRACAKDLKNRGCVKVGVMGFCMGGALSLAAAALVPEVDAAAPFYGVPSDDLCDVSKIKIPVQCHFGEQDDIAGFSDVGAQSKLKEKLKGGKVNFEFHSYPAKHAFTNHTSPNYNKEACEASFQRAMEFFRKHLCS
ncbi:protein usf-like isoform X2 [Babylonia areolata]